MKNIKIKLKVISDNVIESAIDSFLPIKDLNKKVPIQLK